jgi:hypothetical protein
MNIQINTDSLILVPINKTYAKYIFEEFTVELTKYMEPKPSETLEGVFTYIFSCRTRIAIGYFR